MMDKNIFLIYTAVCIISFGTNGALSSSVSCAQKFEMFPGHTACIEASDDATSEAPSTQERQDIVEKHNTLRGGVSPAAANMMKMSWDDEVAMLAQKWADSCPVSGNQLSHDIGQNRFVPGRFSVGQNMGLGHASFDAVIQAWYDEVDDYTYGTAYFDHGGVIGHYTQVVWAQTVKIGCGRATCDGRTIYVCNYAPAGNVGNFMTPYNSGARGGECEVEENGLCDCGGLVCWNGTPLNPQTCTCSCNSRFIAPECSLNCDQPDEAHCGTGAFTSDNCISPFSSFVTSSCSQLCGICPFAEKDYVDDNGGGGQTGGCEDRWHAIGQTCVKVFKKKRKTFEGARTFCQRKGGDLATNIYTYSNRKLIMGGIKYRDHFWIGVHSPNLNGEFSFIDESILIDGPFKNGRPHNERPKFCVAMKTNKLWYDKKCEKRFPFICQKPATP